MRHLYTLILLFLFAGFMFAQEERITNGDFENATEGWALETSDAAAGTFDIDDTSPISGSASGHVTVDAVTGTGWHLQFFQSFGAVSTNMRVYMTYTIRASADASISAWVQQNHDPYGTLYSKGLSLSAEAQTFTDSMDIYEDDTDLKITWILGDLPVGTEVWFDDVSITVVQMEVDTTVIPTIDVPGVEKIVNGRFEEGADPWELELQQGGEATYEVDAENTIAGTGSAHVTVTNSTGTDWHVQFKQQLDNVKAGSTYYILFQAKASEEVTVKATIQQYHDPYAFLTDKDVTITTETQTFMDTSEVLTEDDDNIKFTFLLGNIGNVELWFDNITIIEVTPVEPADIAIDAQKDAFYDGLSNPNDGMIYFPARSHLTESGFGAPDNDEDNSAILWAAWDTTYLYYYAEVTDDIILVNNTTTWQNDCIEIKYDPDPTVPGSSGAIQTRMTAYGVDDAQNPDGVDDINDDGMLLDTSGNPYEVTYDDYARLETSTGYILEWRIPLAYLNTDTRIMKAGVGGVFGSAINVADNDGTQRETMLQWSAGMQDAAWSNVQLHGSVTFLADNKLKYEAVSPHDPTIVNDSAAAWYFGPDTDVPNQISNVPKEFTLGQNYPNPFNPTTTISYNLDKAGIVSLTVYSITGEVIRNLVSNREQSAGSYEITWDSRNNEGVNVSSGVYFYQVKLGDTKITKKMVLMR